MKYEKEVSERFWWDYHRTQNAIVVESIEADYAVIAAFEYPPGKPDEAIAQADTLLEDILAGRTSPRLVSKTLPEKYKWNRKIDGLLIKRDTEGNLIRKRKKLRHALVGYADNKKPFYKRNVPGVKFEKLPNFVTFDADDKRGLKRSYPLAYDVAQKLANELMVASTNPLPKYEFFLETWEEL